MNIEVITYICKLLKKLEEKSYVHMDITMII